MGIRKHKNILKTTLNREPLKPLNREPDNFFMEQAKDDIIIYGGSFDPPHKGHTALLCAALREIKPRRIYVVPAFQSPFKDAAPVSFLNRFNMLKLSLGAVRPIRTTRASRFEGQKKRVTYTFETIKHFRRLHPGAKIYFLLGSDCLAGFWRWKNRRGILKNAVLLVGARRGFPFKNYSNLPGSAVRRVPFRRLKGFFPEISSTSLRVGLLTGVDSRFIAAPVKRYIRQKKLYFSKERRFLKQLLTPARYVHSLSVARLAAELAALHGESPQRAALAGLLHDAARDFGEVRLMRYAVSKKLKIPCFARTAAPILLHSYASAEVARGRFGVRDKTVLRAIALHTSGAARMDTLSKIIYVADLASEDRKFSQAKKIARLARRDLDEAFLAANYVKLKYAAKRQAVVGGKSSGRRLQATGSDSM
ncbi:MAG: nicotinate (nicotinamide) nucleotide adenylyltransferase [Elusimicrobia bacterium GWC2_51_8]|nr:MAG: nicotinate (nicotinamide) nucleotide adenylyltransferase [Elusimicrobia bacterium GWC2_51_8]